MSDLQDAAAVMQERQVQATLAALHGEATRRCGFDDFGASDYLQPLTLLVEELASTPMSDVGRAIWKEELTLALVGRAVREANWKANPAYRARAIERPLVICGIPRTGTTALHKVLSMDPQFQGLDQWLTGWPMPRPPRERWADEPGYKLAEEVIRARSAGMPGFDAAHEVVVDEVEECLQLLRLDFVANHFPALAQVDDYDRWYQAQDQTPLYHRLADTLRLIGLHDDRPWLLKNPGHFAEMEALLAAFPDARVVITHRDPVKAIGSLVSLLSNPQRAVDPDVDLRRTAARELAYWAQGKRRTEAVRARHPAEQFYDVDHVQFHKDPIGTVRGLYDHFGLGLSAEVEGRMRAWLAANPADKHGVHRYALEDFGLTPEQVRAELQEG